MKSTTFHWNNYQKAEKYLFQRGKLESTCLLTCLPCVNQEISCMSSENCFAIFDQSSHVIYLTWYRLFIFFPEFTSIIPFMKLFQDFLSNWGEGVHFYVKHHVLVFGRSYFFKLKAKYPVFHFLDLFGTILNLI